MDLIGLHVLDLGIILLYIVIILWLGWRAGSDTKNTSDFYIAGRRLGKVYQFFLNFGNATDSSQAVGVSREIYRMGIGGMWIQFLVLFLTPFYWFTSMLFRRCRQITIGDYFTERFNSPFLGGAFAIFTLVMAFIGGGASYMVAGKTMEAMTPKPLERCTVEERAAHIAEMREKRSAIQDEIRTLGDQQKAFIDKARAENAAQAERSLDTALLESLTTQARAKGLSFPTPSP